jgi:hypothetical protein
MTREISAIFATQDAEDAWHANGYMNGFKQVVLAARDLRDGPGPP